MDASPGIRCVRTHGLPSNRTQAAPEAGMPALVGAPQQAWHHERHCPAVAEDVRSAHAWLPSHDIHETKAKLPLAKESLENGVGTTRARLNTAMQAVDAFVDIDGREVRAIIPREVLEGRLHAEATPQAWLKACADHEDELNAIIGRKLSAKPQDFVVLRTSDFPARHG